MAKLEGSINDNLEYIYIYIFIYSSLTRSYIPTPKKLANKNPIINLQNKDDKCFLYSTSISVYYDEIDKKYPGRVSKKLSEYRERLNIDNINFPRSIKDIQQFEKDNPDISITSFEYGGFHKIKEDDNDDHNTKE